MVWKLINAPEELCDNPSQPRSYKPPGWANAIAGAIVVEVDRKKLQAMRDAEIEQRYLAGRYRGEIDEL